MTFLPADFLRDQDAEAGRHSLSRARQRGFPIPASIPNAEALLLAVHAAADNLEAPIPELPDTSTEVANALITAAAQRAAREHARALAAEWQPEARERLRAAINASVAGWVPPLVDAFDTALEGFRAAAAAAPQVGADALASLDPTSFECWQQAQAASTQLDAIVEDRRILAVSLHERFVTAEFGDLLPLVAVIAPPDGRDADALLSAARDRRPVLDNLGKGSHSPRLTAGGMPTTLAGVDRWRALLDAQDRGWLRLALASTGQAQQRVELLEVWAAVPRYLHADGSNRGPMTQTTSLLERVRHLHATLTAA